MIGALVAGITGAGGAVLSSYESIATANGTGSSGVITFSSIPSTFKHLQLRIFHLHGTTGEGDLDLTFNSDTTAANYAVHYLYGTGSSVAASGATSVGLIRLNGVYYGATSTYPSVSVVDILDYGSTTKNKTVRIFEGTDRNGTGSLSVDSGLWINTSAITSMTITCTEGNYATTTKMSLYGIKEA